MAKFEYKGYVTFANYDAETKFYHGKLEGIGDLVNFGGYTLKEFEDEFCAAVEDYISFCESQGRTTKIAMPA